MEQPLLKQKPQRKPREWDAQAYDEGNILQTNAFLYFLETNSITTENRTILDVGCGTGKIAAQLAEKAIHIHGFDASKNMINFAQNRYQQIHNLSFEQCFAEDFISSFTYQLALASFCIHWFENKKQAFQRINDSLEINGEFFGLIRTRDNPEPIHFTVFIEMMPLIQTVCSSYIDTTDSNLAGSTYPSHQELINMLKETNFEIINIEEQSYEYTMTENEHRKLQWPIFSSRPIFKNIPTELVAELFEGFMNRYMQKYQKINNEIFLGQITTTIVHARKK
jgi:ubiquinone/menaquinone biosynthesis C-methylase UbiE